MKKLLCLALALLIFSSFAACGAPDPAESSAEEASFAASEEGSSPEPMSGPEISEPEESLPEESEPEVGGPKINGHSLNEYRIVYRLTSLPARYETVAYELRDYIAGNYGVTLEVYAENDGLDRSETEFLVGMCIGRDFCDEYYYETYEERGDYFLAVSGGTVLMAASYANGAYFAMKELIALMEKGEDIGDMNNKGREKVVKVACVGDSITQGINSSDQNKTYPIYLQDALGLGYFVMNYGMSGYSIVSTDEYAYRKASVYNSSLNFEPDVVIFALGTNDANPTASQPYKAWEGTDRTEKFIQSTKDLLDSYLSLKSKPQIFICLPCSLFKVGSDGWNAVEWTARVEKYPLPLLKQIAEEYGLPTIDLWTWSKAHPQVFTDGLHPKDETYKDFALAIYDEIKDLI